MTKSLMAEETLIVNAVRYYWSITEDAEMLGSLFLTIRSENDNFLVKYLLNTNLLIVIGDNFNPKKESLDKDWVKIPYRENTITPKFVEKIISWSLEDKAKIEYLGFNYILNYSL